MWLPSPTTISRALQQGLAPLVFWRVFAKREREAFEDLTPGATAEPDEGARDDDDDGDGEGDDGETRRGARDPALANDGTARRRDAPVAVVEAARADRGPAARAARDRVRVRGRSRARAVGGRRKRRRGRQKKPKETPATTERERRSETNE